jgi:hypothetical protein
MSWVITPSFYGYITDADAKDYLSRVHAAEGQTLEPAVALAIESFVVGCKADGIWTAIKASCILAGARTLAGSLVPLVGTAPTNFNFVSGDYNRKTGLVGDGTSKYLNSNRNNNADPQNSQHLSTYISSALTAYAIGNNPATVGSSAFLASTALGEFRIYSRAANSSDYYAAPGEQAATGFAALSRNTGSEFIARLNASNRTAIRTSNAPVSENIFVFARAPGAAFNNSRLAFYSIGESLNLALLDARVTDLINAFAAAIP